MVRRQPQTDTIAGQRFHFTIKEQHFQAKKSQESGLSKMKSLGIGLTQILNHFENIFKQKERNVCGKKTSPLFQGNAYNGGKVLYEVNKPK